MKYNINQIISFVQKRISSVGFSSDLEEQLKFYKLGQKNEVPEEWKKFIPELTPEEIAMEKHPLQFEYCECGCKCYSGTSKGIEYSIYWNLKAKNGFRLWRGHSRYGVQIGKTYDTYEQAVMAAQKDWSAVP